MNHPFSELSDRELICQQSVQSPLIIERYTRITNVIVTVKYLSYWVCVLY